jgi:hypothetical protein
VALFVPRPDPGKTVSGEGSLNGKRIERNKELSKGKEVLFPFALANPDKWFYDEKK